MHKKLDDKIIEELIDTLEVIKKSGTNLIHFKEKDYTPDELIEEIRGKTSVGLGYYNMSLKYREMAKKLKP